MLSPPLLMRHRLRHFTVRPWREEFGAAEHPEIVLGSQVAEIIRVRDDEAGALVRLADRRYAITGAILAAGGRTELRRYAYRRAVQLDSAAQRRWYEECAYLLDAPRSARWSTR